MSRNFLMVEIIGFEPMTPACKAGALPTELYPHNGAGEGIRTLDPNLGKVVLYPELRLPVIVNITSVCFEYIIFITLQELL